MLSVASELKAALGGGSVHTGVRAVSGWGGLVPRTMLESAPVAPVVDQGRCDVPLYACNLQSS